jgi:dipeptidyl-peptidase-4
MLVRFSAVLLLAAAGLDAQKGAAQRKPVTIEAITATHKVGEAGSPIWAPNGKAFAYRQGDKINLYEMGPKRSRELLQMESLKSAATSVPADREFGWENRGVREDMIQWLPSGNALLVGASGDLFVWHAETGKHDQLTATAVAERDPKLSPDGRFVSFRRQHDLYVLELESRKETRLTATGSETLLNAETDWVYPEELSLGTAHWWSPDSRFLAYLQFDVQREPLYPHADLLGLRAVYEPQRYPQAGEPNADVLLGVVPVTGGRTHWMDVSGTRYQHLLARVNWTPDSRRLAVQRLTRVQDRLDLLMADAATGESRTVLTETDSSWINLSDDLRLLDNGRQFVWSSERSGFRHLYLYSYDGKEVQPLTSGAWEVRGVVGIGERNDRVYYLSSEPSPMETHLYSVGTNGKRRVRLTSDAGWHTISVSPGANYFMDAYSNYTTPARRVLRTADGAEYAVFRESDRNVLDEYDYLPSEDVKIKAADGKTDLYGRITRPAGFDATRRYPVMVFVYGGPGAQRIRNQFGGLTGESGMIQALAHRGYVVWQLDNRGSTGRGHRFESAVNRTLGVVELADQKAGVDYVKSLAFVDGERVGIFGWSYGGFMTLNAMLNSPDTFRAGVAGAPVTSFANYDTIYTERYMGLPVENPEGYKKTNLSLAASNLKGSLMIIHNFQDDNVLFQNTLQIVDALERAGKRFELMIYPQKTHGVTGPVRRQMVESVFEFIDRHLKKL